MLLRTVAELEGRGSPAEKKEALNHERRRKEQPRQLRFTTPIYEGCAAGARRMSGCTGDSATCHNARRYTQTRTISASFQKRVTDSPRRHSCSITLPSPPFHPCVTMGSMVHVTAPPNNVHCEEQFHEYLICIRATGSLPNLCL